MRIFLKLEKKFRKKRMTSKLEGVGGGVSSLVVGPIKKTFCGFPSYLNFHLIKKKFGKIFLHKFKKYQQPFFRAPKIFNSYQTSKMYKILLKTKWKGEKLVLMSMFQRNWNLSSTQQLTRFDISTLSVILYSSQRDVSVDPD